jgi:hypothetical protein
MPVSAPPVVLRATVIRSVTVSLASPSRMLASL